MKLKRSCGILLPVAALPSEHGIGTLGRAAYDFVDFLAAAGQSWWQILPVGPTGYGDSPYQSFSTRAGNPYFVDLELLTAEGLLAPGEAGSADWGSDARYVDYEKIYRSRFRILRLAAERGIAKERKALDDFVSANADWLPDYALFMALKEHFGHRPWTEWPDAAIRAHESAAAERYARELKADVEFYEYVQLLFCRQWEALHAYAKKRGVGLIGDMPIYVAADSADVWASPQFFQLDGERVPTAVAGVPPDYFSADGQLWGNPLYDWDALRADGYGWWIRRVDGAARLYDAVRIDHFRGFESYWAVPRGEKTARNGSWIKGPGMDLVGRLTSWFPDVPFIAEDLGLLTPEVRALLKESGLPGMKVLEFAFDSGENNDYLPHGYTENCICYVGTHDNAPLKQWLKESSRGELRFARRYLGLNRREGYRWGIIRGGMSSAAAVFIAQMQDYLGLGAESRTNTPGTPGGNWRWRLLPSELSGKLAKKLNRLSRMYGRSGTADKEENE